ncbi:phenylalanine--tRNA ligase subunit alpha [bacterium]|nr:phenylalanine--tRNA ligase subunit alpha [bacterium]
MSEPTTTDSTPQPEAAPSALDGLLADVKRVGEAARDEFKKAGSTAAVEELRIKYLGKKGQLAEINQRFGQLSNEEKPIAGKLLNSHKAQIINLAKERREALELAEINARLKAEGIDVTLPGTAPAGGHAHPILQVQRQVEEIFRALGFQITESPQVESEWVNFDALNFMADHPARDMQDTFFTERGRVLRTHTSGNQIRTMIDMEPPLAVISSGKVYRCDSDVTHSPMFFQTEGYMVGRDISMAHLKGVLNEFLHALYGPEIGTRFRPSFFPFTEPSAEVDIECVFCGGDGCRICSDSGWLEVLGCGMIHPVVLRNCGIDPDKWSGFAFGVGLDRIAMLKYGINDIRLLYEGDLRFLSQF